MNQSGRKGKKLSGVYISSDGARRVMTRKDFLTKLHLRDPGQTRWRRARAGE